MDAKSEVNSRVDGLCQDAFDSYASIQQYLYQSLAEVSKRQNEAFDCEAMELQQDVHDALYSAAGGVLKLFVAAH